MPPGGPILPLVRNSGWAPFHLPADLEPFAELRKKMREKDISDSELKKLKERYIQELAEALKDKSKRDRIRKSVLEGEPHSQALLLWRVGIVIW